ncbi:hypothetical protein ONZ45_g4177 [Pleurotus djamor]|nr:hypothetical protein ONZ45_g4177 [Pleurotus djamor]
MTSFHTMASLLMHAALAQVSPQLQTIDNIISQPRTPAHPLKPTLPLELLLLIRRQLLLTLTDHLIAQSDQALFKYEDSIRSLLCDECLDWNEEVYGRSVWHWQRPSGPCWCNSTMGLIGGSDDDEADVPKVEWFRDPLHWLESHLSKSPCVPPTSDADIWRLVCDILREYQCQVVRDAETKPKPLLSTFRWPWNDSQPLNDRVSLIPFSGPGECQTTICSLAGSGHDHRCHKVILRRVERDLGLPLFSSVDLSSMPSLTLPWDAQFTFSRQSPCNQTSTTAPIFPTRSRPRRQSALPLLSSHSHLLHRLIEDGLLIFVSDILTSITALLLCAPLALLTMLAHIFCYYARPGVLRVL